MSELTKGPAVRPDGPSAAAPAPEETSPRAGTGAGEWNEAGAAGLPQTTYWRVVRARFLQNRLAVVGLVIVVGLVLTAAVGPLLVPHDPSTPDLDHTMEGPSGEHWFGTDGLGRDLLSRLIAGTRLALLIGLASIVLTCAIGVTLGALAGYAGNWVDAVIMRTADVFLAFPLLVGAIAIILVTGQGVWPVIAALALFSWATVARLLRSSMLSVREADYVAAARALGAGHTRIVLRHILPNSMTPVLVYAAFNTGTAIVSVASLSFLGIGVAPGVPEWGNILAEGRQFIGVSDHLWAFPSLAIVLTVLAFVFVGDGLRDALDPKLH